MSPRPSSASTSFAGDRVPGGGPGQAAGMGVWSGEGSASNGSSLDGSKSSNTTLQPGMHICVVYRIALYFRGPKLCVLSMLINFTK